jgi:serine/threonine protein phosphatase PrpC
MNTCFPKIEVASLGSKTRTSGLNEDAIGYCLFDSREENNIGPVAVICMADGMTTLASPHYASSHAIQTAMEVFFSSRLPSKGRSVQMLIAANNALLNHTSKQDFGTTFTAVVVSNEMIHIANIGDNRVYQISDSQIKCLTQDHSRLAEQLGGNPDKTEAKASQKSKKLARSLGEKPFGADYLNTHNCAAKSGDIFIICTDGLWTEFDEHELLSLADEKAEALAFADLAMKRDNTDDVSVVLLRL